MAWPFFAIHFLAFIRKDWNYHTMYSRLFTHPFSFFLSAQLFFLLCLFSSARQKNKQTQQHHLLSLSKNHYHPNHIAFARTLFYKTKTPTGGHCWQHTDIVPTSAPQSFATSRSSFCLSLLHPSVLLRLFLSQGDASPQLLVSSPPLSSLPLHADTHTMRDKRRTCHTFIRRIPTLFSCLLNLSDSKHPAEIHFSQSSVAKYRGGYFSLPLHVPRRTLCLLVSSQTLHSFFCSLCPTWKQWNSEYRLSQTIQRCIHRHF